MQAQRYQAERLAELPQALPHLHGVAGVAPDLVAQLAGVAGARDHHRAAVVVAQTADQEAEPAELFQLGLAGRGPDHLAEQLAAQRALHGDVVDLLGGRLDPHLHAELLRLLAQPVAGEVLAAHPAEAVRSQTQQGAVVEHAAVLVAHRRVDHLADRQLAHVAGQAVVEQRLGVRAEHLELAQRGQVHHRHPLAAAVVFLEGAEARIVGRRPPAAVVDEVAGQRAGTGVEAALAGQHRVGVGGLAGGHGHAEALLGGIHADVDVGGLPAVGRVDVVRAGAAGADQVGHRA
ncbi:hypothetical protein D3C80_727600 [compost metagenome]